MIKDEEIIIVPYDSGWPDKFAKEKVLLESTIRSYIIGGIHHIGSTSVPGLSAKPIIDILVGVESLEASVPCIKLLKQIDYQYYPYRADKEHWFCKPSPAHRTHHLHLVPVDHPEFKARLVFRDYMRTHKKERDVYEELKKRLAVQFRNNRQAYTDAKTDFVKTILTKAL